MASRYSIIQYVPHPSADERINIGVLVFNKHKALVHFLKNWERVRHFGLPEDMDSLQDFVHEMTNATEKGLLFPGDSASSIPTYERLIEVARGWMNSIQFTEPRGSLESPEQLLGDLVQTYLFEPPAEEQDLDKQQVDSTNISTRSSTDSVNSILVSNKGAGSKKVLFVDNSITVRELLSTTFSKAGYEVEEARDGVEALEKIKSEPFDLIFLDVEMPNMDGLEVLSRLQQDPKLQNLPVVMFTSRGVASKYKKMAIDLGAKAYFTKPFMEKDLLNAVSRVMNGEILTQ
jgi:CheY-like chemotaxis protein